MISRRGLLAASAALPLIQGGWARATSLPTPMLSNDVPMLQRPRIRWWWPGGAIEPAEVAREVDVLADAGFGGFEIADVRDNITVPMDPRVYGWGGERWLAGVEAALRAAERRKLKPDLTIGAHWPTAIPGVVPDDEAASKELVHGEAVISGGATFKGPLPPPIQSAPSGEIPGVNDHLPVTPRIIAVQAMRIIGSGSPLRLDPHSMVDLTHRLQTPSETWTAPPGGKWCLISFWMRGTGQIQNMFNMNRAASMLSDPKPYVVDIYSKAGAKAVTDYWDRTILTPSIRDLVRRTGASVFEDSLEMSAARNWTPYMLQEFRARRGYSLLPYLALLPSTKAAFSEMFLGRNPPAVYDLDGIDRSRVLDDYERTLAELYDENRVRGIADWAHGHGMTFRVQAVGSNVNSGVAASIADIPEGDNSNDVHGWKRFAAGRDIGHRRILSDEAGTFVGGNAHVAGWRDLIYMLQRDFGGGVNQAVIHGTPYSDAPGAGWPGFSAFGRAIGNDWGPRDPSWAVVNDATAVIGRLQAFLQTGSQKTDVAVLGDKLRSVSLQRAGYSWQYPAEELFQQPGMVVEHHRLMPGGPSYRALVINRVTAIDPATAARLVSYAEAQLPVVIIGTPPERARGWHEAVTNDRIVAERIRRLLAYPSVKTVSTGREVAQALKALGVIPSMGFTGPETILGLRRQTENRDLFFLLNDSGTSTQQNVSLEGSGTLQRVDQWTGNTRAVEGAIRQGDRILFSLSLAKDEAALFIIANSVPGATPQRAFGSSRILQLSNWSLDVEDWQAGSGPTAMRKQLRHFARFPLRAWSEVPELVSVSGVGRYRTTVDLTNMPIGAAAWLDLGKVGGTPRVIVNGTQLPPVNLFTLRVDVGRWLRPGRNDFEVVVATSLNNRLLALGIKPAFGPPPGEAGPPMAQATPPAAPIDRDEQDGPLSMPGMQPGAGPPGTPRVEQQYGLFGPVSLHMNSLMEGR